MTVLPIPPSADEQHASVLAALRSRPRPTELVDLPKTYPEGQQLRMRVLTHDESCRASIFTEKWVREKRKKMLGEVPKADEPGDTYAAVLPRTLLEDIHLEPAQVSTLRQDEDPLVVSDADDQRPRGAPQVPRR